jgi:hypothetical protein
MENMKMKTLTRTLTLAGLGLALMVSGAQAQKTAGDIMKESHLAYYYAGDDGLAQVTMNIIDKRGKERNREFVMLRIDKEDGGKQMYYTYFKKPSDVARLTFMVHKNADANDDRWIYVPAVDLVKRISADDKNSSFVGSDFSYEDVSGRHWSEDAHTLVKDSTWEDAAIWIIESVPNGDWAFDKKVSYIDQTSLLPYREEYFEDGEVVKVMQSEKIEEADGIMTITHRTMNDLKKERVTHVIFDNIDYNVGVKDEVFTERFLVNPPMQYIK